MPLNVIQVYYQLENLSKADPPYKSVAALNCVVLGCANIWDLDRAYQTFNAMETYFGLTPDIHSYNALICAFAKLNKVSNDSLFHAALSSRQISLSKAPMQHSMCVHGLYSIIFLFLHASFRKVSEDDMCCSVKSGIKVRKIFGLFRVFMFTIMHPLTK